MMYLELFLVFLQIGAVSFGGGYGMISLIREKVLSHGWLTEKELLDMIAVSESTPGPLAVNMATFIGSSQGGILGSFFATLGVVMPSFFIILFIAALLKNIMKYAGVQAFLSGIRPCVVAMILSTAVTMGLGTLFSVRSVGDIGSLLNLGRSSGAAAPDYKGIFIFVFLIVLHVLWKHFRKKTISPILIVLLSARLGMLAYGVL
ncbi:MAG TPA: chromate transporter [Clostridiales bacterium]|nr:chromate transporter [Clostridiales bacterium]